MDHQFPYVHEQFIWSVSEFFVSGTELEKKKQIAPVDAACPGNQYKKQIIKLKPKLKSKYSSSSKKMHHYFTFSLSIY